MLLAVVGLFVFLSPRLLITQIHFGTAPTWHQFIYGISIGTVAYTGIETISNMAEEAANPGRDVPRAVKFVLLAVLGVYFAISMVGLSAMPVHYNIVPVNPATHMTIPQAILPDAGRRCRPGPGTTPPTPAQKVYVLPNASGTAYAVGQADRQGLRAERPARDQALGHAARDRLGGRPAAGHRARTCPTTSPGCASSWRPGSPCWRPPS